MKKKPRINTRFICFYLLRIFIRWKILIEKEKFGKHCRIEFEAQRKNTQVQFKFQAWMCFRSNFEKIIFKHRKRNVGYKIQVRHNEQFFFFLVILQSIYQSVTITWCFNVNVNDFLVWTLFSSRTPIRWKTIYNILWQKKNNPFAINLRR